MTKYTLMVRGYKIDAIKAVQTRYLVPLDCVEIDKESCFVLVECENMDVLTDWFLESSNNTIGALLWMQKGDALQC